MTSTSSALDTLMKTVSSVAERLFSIRAADIKFCRHCGGPMTDLAWTRIKDTRNALSSALCEARRATTTEQPTFGETKSSSTLNDILAAIEAHALVSAELTKIIVSRLRVIGEDLQTSTNGNDGCES